MVYFSALALVATLAFGLVQAEPTPTAGGLTGRGYWPGQKDANGCNKNTEFYFPTRKCCLPHGGPVKKAPPPPPGQKCPPSTHYWNPGQGCCVPFHPNPPPPSCPPQWEWQPNRQCCIPKPPPPPPPQPSKKPSPPKHYRNKRSTQWDTSFCPGGYTTCPVYIDGFATGDSECVDTYADLTSCGGCASIKTGVNCSKIPNAKFTTCQAGECVVDKCMPGFHVSADETACV